MLKQSQSIIARRRGLAGLVCCSTMFVAQVGIAQTPPSKAPSPEPNVTWNEGPAVAPSEAASASPPTGTAPSNAPAATASPAPAILPPQRGYIVIDPATGRPMSVSGQYSGMQSRPATLPYEEGQPIPRGYVVRESNLSGLVIGGIIPLSIFYLISFSVASGNNFSGPAGWLAVPVIGPFGWLAAHKSNPSCASDEVCTDAEDVVGRTFVTMDGIFQTAGAAMFIAGLAITRKKLVLIENQEMYIVPYASSMGHGLSILGRF